MLECGYNFKGTIKTICEKCNTDDNENHRLNYCSKWNQGNFVEIDERTNFNDIYADEIDTVRTLITRLEKVWNTRNAHGSMQSKYSLR